MRILLVVPLALLSCGCADQSRFTGPTNRADGMLYFVERDRRNEEHQLSSSPDEGRDVTTRVPNPALVDIDSLIEIGVRQPTGEPGRRIFGADDQDLISDKQAMMDLLEALGDVIAARQDALEAYNDGRPTAEFESRVIESATRTRAFISAFREVFPRDSDDPDDIEAYRTATRAVGDGGIQRLQPFLQAKIDEIEERDDRIQARARSRSSSLRVEAFLDSPDSELSALHLRGYDSLPEGRLVSRDRLGINLTEQERAELTQQIQATEDLARTLEAVRTDEISLQQGAFDTLEIVAPDLADLVEEATEIAARLSDPDRLAALEASLEQAADEAKQQVDGLTTGLENRIDAIPDTLRTELQQQSNGVEATLAIIAGARQIESDWESIERSQSFTELPALLAQLNALGDQVSNAFQDLPGWLEEGADITEALVGGEIEGIQNDAASTFNNFLESEAATEVSANIQSYMDDIRSGANVIKQVRERLKISDVNVASTAPDVPEAFDVDIEQLQDTLLDLRRVPGSVGDTVLVRGRLSTPGREPVETSATFEITRYGHYARLVPSVVLVRPDEIASGEDEFRFAPSLGWMHHYRPRPTDTGWWANMMRPLEAAGGLHAIFLNFDNEAGIGLGGTISFWNDRLQFGGGYNLSANSSDEGRYYFFIGSDLIGLLQAVGLGD